jgi:Fe-S-cluster containining protein
MKSETIKLPAGDTQLIQIVDAALADAARRSGDWLVCRPGCTQCCIGVFAIDQLDAARLEQGLRELMENDPERAHAVVERARRSVKRLSQDFPGDPATGLLDPAQEARFEDFANDEPCAALDPATGLCDLYRSRPMTCRVFGPPVRSEEGLGVCELCYHGATEEQIAACEMPVSGLEEELLQEFEQASGRRGQTLVAFALALQVPGTISFRLPQESRTMPANPVSTLNAAVSSAAADAGLSVVSSEEGIDFNGRPTAIFRIGLAPDAPAERTLRLELSEDFDFHRPELLPEMTAHLRDEAKRLRNPRPDAYVTMAGMPISFSDFRWPFHRSVSGADTYIVHGVVHVADGTDSLLHAKVSASMTVTFAEIVPAPEQPYAETFIYSAIRKTLDQGQLELLKSGNRQPVPVTTRYYSRWQKKFFFTDTDEQSRQQFLLAKIFWLSGVLGDSQPVWIADPRDAQYLNTTAEELVRAAEVLASAGLVTLGEDFAAATPVLLAREAEFRGRLQQAFALTKPTFNEDMRAGHTNM